MNDDDLAAARRRVESTQSALADLNHQRERLLERRCKLFAKLLDDGVRQAELARWAGVTQQAVAFAVAKARSSAA